MENVITIGLVLPEQTKSAVEEHLEELTKLTETAGATVTGSVIARRPAPDPATYIGKGKAEEVKRLAEAQQATLIIFDDDLSPAQVRNLEKLIGARVIDRSALILDIFSSRARTREARTQVELAQLEYMLPRLTRAWSHLERQGGGTAGGGGGGTGGARRGVGETQLELDRRIVRTRIARLKEDLKHIEKTRETQRRSRGEGAFTVSLVGYTNAGKSTLFNRLTTGGAEAMDQLFATLDAKSHKAAFEMPRETVIIDTVGFIRKLPHHLVASFRSTMEEAVASDLVLHVIDASHPQYEEQRAIGEEVLTDLGVDLARVIEVYNKADRLDEHFDPSRKHGVLVSALRGRGIEKLVDTIRIREREGGALLHLVIPHSEGRLTAQLHELAEVQEQHTTDEALIVTAWVPNAQLHLFRAFAVPHRAARAS